MILNEIIKIIMRIRIIKCVYHANLIDIFMKVNALMSAKMIL